MNFITKNHVFGRILRQNHILLISFKLNFKSWNITFFGSDDFSVVSLQGLHTQMKKKLVNNLEVVTLNDCCPVYSYAKSNNIKIHFWPPTLNESFDVGVVVSFGKLIPKRIIEKFPLGIINVHPSLLPRWRGAAPIIYALKTGDTTTGITISLINHDKFDTGDIIMQKSCSIGENEVMPSLHKRLSQLGSEYLQEVIEGLPECLNNRVKQCEENVSKAPKITKNASVVKWEESTALEIYNLYRALFGVFELRTTWQGFLVKLMCMSPGTPSDDSSSSGKTEVAAGNIEYNAQNQCLVVQCKDKPVRICTVQFKGKFYSAPIFYSRCLGRVHKRFWMFGS